MKSPMADANAAIINEVKKFMERAVTDYSEREKYTGEQTKDFTRPRILAFPVLTLMILNAMKRSLSIETEGFFSHSLQGESCTKQAFSKQRGKLLIHGRCATGTRAIFSSEHDWDFVGNNSLIYRNFAN